MQDDNKLSSKQPVKAVANARRSFIKKASIGAPIIIASSAKPAWGAACMSGVMSVYHSGPQATCNLSGGLSHGHWKNHYVGRNDGHYKQRDRSKGLKNKFKDYDGCYYVKTGQTFSFSQYKTSTILGGYNCQNALENGGSYECELITAFISASLAGVVGYPYSIQDVEDIYMTVLAGDADADRVATMLENIHSGSV